MPVLVITDVMCVCSVFQLCLTLYDPMACSQPDFSVQEMFQERILESSAIFYWCFKVSSHSGVRVAFPCGWNAWGADGAGQIFGCDRGLGLFAARVLASPPASWCRLLSRPLAVCTLPSRAQEPSPSWTPSHSAQSCPLVPAGITSSVRQPL